MVYLLIALAPVLITTLFGRVTHRPFLTAGTVSLLTIAYLVGVAIIAAQNNVGVNVVLLVFLPVWAAGTSFAEAFRLRRYTLARAT